MLPTGHFEIIVANDVLEHIERTKTDAVLAEWTRLLAPTGRMYIQVPSLKHLAAWILEPARQDADQAAGIIHMMFGTQFQPGDYHLTSFTRTTLTRHFANAGLHITAVGLFHGWLFDVTASHTASREPVAWPEPATAEAELEAMRRSTSWRVTAPLRALRRLVDQAKREPSGRALPGTAP
jgi:hypothetical protein